MGRMRPASLRFVHYTCKLLLWSAGELSGCWAAPPAPARFMVLKQPDDVSVVVDGYDQASAADIQKFKLSARHGRLWRHSTMAHCCDTRRHDRSADPRRERRQVF
jgi:hypothetical protein